MYIDQTRMKSTIQKFPRQKIPFKSKNKKWRKEHLDWADSNGRLFNETIRKRMNHKKINIDLYNGKINKDDLKLSLNPGNLEEIYIPDNIQHYPIVAPRIDVLVGEEAERRFDWKVRIINPTAISMIEENKKKEIGQKIQELIQMNYSDEEVEKELERFSDYMNFEWQDMREKRGNILLKHFVRELNVSFKFTEGFRDVLLVGEEGYLCDIVHNNPVFEKLNPLKTYVIQHGTSNRYQDASIILIDDYWSPGMFVDKYYDQLTEKDAEYITSGGTSGGGVTDNMDGDRFKEDIDDREGINLARSLSQDMDLYIDAVGGNYPNLNTKGQYFDSHGNVRVLRIFWRSYKEIFKVTTMDPETGEPIIKYRNEDYIVRPELGETVEKLFVSQWWQGVKAGEKVYTDMRPRPIQYNKISDPGYNTPGIVGRIYNTNDQQAVCLMDRAKPFNYIFDGCFHRLMEMYSKFFGPILEIDKAKIPEGWDITKTMYFARKAGILVIDSFKEGKKGMSTGKLAGAVGNTSGKLYNGEIGDYVRENINMMEWCKAQMDEVIGVPKQRLGNVEKRETVGGVDTAIRQGNYVTAMLYKTHDEVKKEALTLLLETAKIAMRGNKLKLAHIGDDYSNQISEMDGDEISEEDYGLDVSNDSDNAALEQNLQQLAQSALQSQMLSFSTIMKVFTSPSLVEIQRLIEKDERQTQERQADAADKEQQNLAAQAERLAAIQDEKLAIDRYDIDERSRIAELKMIMDSDNAAAGAMETEDNTIDYDKLRLDRTKHDDQMEIKRKEIANKMSMHKDKMENDRKKISKMGTKAK